MDYFGNDTAWYGGWCRGRQSINCKERSAEGFCSCVIAELHQRCQKKGCRKKINEGDCIVKTGDGWAHIGCDCGDAASNGRKRRRRRGQREDEIQQPQLNQSNSLDAILDAISKYRSPSEASTRGPTSHRPKVQITANVQKEENKWCNYQRKLEQQPENMEDCKVHAGPASIVTSVAPSAPIVTPQSGGKRHREEETAKSSRANRKLRFEPNCVED